MSYYLLHNNGWHWVVLLSVFYTIQDQLKWSKCQIDPSIPAWVEPKKSDWNWGIMTNVNTSSLGLNPMKEHCIHKKMTFLITDLHYRRSGQWLRFFYFFTSALEIKFNLLNVNGVKMIISTLHKCLKSLKFRGKANWPSLRGLADSLRCFKGICRKT